MVAVVVLSGCGGDQQKLERTTLLVSGRDEHGLLAQRTVGLLGEPDGARVASVQDGTLVHVVEVRGEWLRVRALEGASVEGWVNDYYLRGTVHVATPRGCAARAARAPGGTPDRSLTPNVQAELLAVATREGRAWVQVRTLVEPDVAWVERRAVHELSSPARCQAS